MNALQNLFTDSYSKFTRWVTQVQVDEQASRVQVPEKTIRCVWNEQLFKTRQLRTTGGEDLEIIFPGHWNFGPGPDFKNAAIKVNGKTFEGDVALHVYSSDWKPRRSSETTEYGKIVLNVFLWKDTSGTPSADETAPFELELKSFLTKGIFELNDELDFDSYPVLHQHNYGRCHQPLARLSKEKLTHLLNAAGDARILVKIERFHDRTIINGYEQTFYEGVAEALGYPNNKEPFQKLAGTLRLSTLQGLLPEKIDEAEKILHIQALMFGVAGLVEFKSLDTAALPADDQKYFAKLKNLWETYRADVPDSRLTRSQWKFGGIRPANFPYRRIAALAHMIVRHEENGMFADYMHQLQACISAGKNEDYKIAIPNKLYDFFCVEADDYWAGHYSPGGKQLAKAQLLVGPTRSREITVNIVIPIGMIYARASKSVALETAFNVLFQSGKKSGDNKLLRFMRHYIFGNKADMIQVLENDKQTQGLMQIYQDFCTQNGNNCLRCQFPDVVAKHFS
ncbi:MAG: hypothetical protein NPINA01_24680 [Nitrospinaceae bacterium]|nr:MAG: hypothetical protein NPINA01_24680 [Nitrospinaceae bacterium]